MLVIKKYLVIVFGILVSLAGLWQLPPEIVNSEIFGINKLPAHNYIWTSPDLANAKASTYSVSFNSLTGMIAEYKINGQILIEGGTSFNLWRALTENDVGWQVDQKMKSRENEGENAKLTGLVLSDLNDWSPVITGNYSFKETQSIAQLQYTIHSDGAIKVCLKMMIPDRAPNVPRIGLQFALNKQFQNIEWYGRGPYQNYADRKTASEVGICRLNLNDFITPYVRPQENANRCDVRWLKLSQTDDEQICFTAAAGSTFSMSAWPYSQNSLNEATQDFELRPDKFIRVNIDCAQMGLGGDNSWGFPLMIRI